MRLRSLPLLGLLLTIPAALRADYDANPFLGVTLSERTITSPRLITYDLVTIDLGAPGIRFEVTPQSGPMDTTLETTRSFVDRVGAQIGINANYFSPADAAAGTPADVVSLAASNGNVYSPFLNSQWSGVNIGADNAVTFVDPVAGDSTGLQTNPNVPLYNAVSGFGRLLRDGVAGTLDDGTLNARTAIGLTADHHLLLLTVDGRNLSRSYGVSLPELAALIQSLGAVNAVALDGGGSTTMVVADPSARVVNVPVNKYGQVFERPVGNNLAVFAAPVPEPGSLALLAVGGAFVLRRAFGRRRVVTSGRSSAR